MEKNITEQSASGEAHHQEQYFLQFFYLDADSNDTYQRN